MPNDSRFRFPEEIRQLFECMVKPFGFMEAEVGDDAYYFLQTLEKALHDNTKYKHGKDAFGKDNYPHIAPHILLIFGRNWVKIALERAAEDSDALKDISMFKLDRIAQGLEEAAKRCRELDRLIKKDKEKGKDKGGE